MWCHVYRVIITAYRTPCADYRATWKYRFVFVTRGWCFRSSPVVENISIWRDRIRLSYRYLAEYGQIIDSHQNDVISVTLDKGCIDAHLVF